MRITITEPQQMLPLKNESILSVGSPVWNSAELVQDLKGFLPFYQTRPIQDNSGGMKSSGLFTLWSILKKIKPRLVVESGVWKGQSTWLIENTLPQIPIFAIDPASDGILYKTKQAEYTTKDFLLLDWKGLGEILKDTLVFFDDHQDVFKRLQLCQELGIKNVILDDNYPVYNGNRHISMAAILNQKLVNGNYQFPQERKFLLDTVESYHPFPPLFDYTEAVTMEKSFIQVPSLLGAYDPIKHSGLEPYWQDASSYRWTTLVKFK